MKLSIAVSNRSISVLSSTSLTSFSQLTHIRNSGIFFLSNVCLFFVIEQELKGYFKGFANCCYFIRIYAPSST
nr:MAG TPA: hypothetical protein [Caudoviricetes sp.]DAZ66501.1 MAG TPA: hypothetical protein [Caudoviricetes sp.]